MNEQTSTSVLTRLFRNHEFARLKITLKHGDTFVLEGFDPVDPNIYNDKGRWCATVIEAVSGKSPIFKKLFLPGSGLDILEEDIQEIVNAASGQILFPIKDNAAEQGTAANP
jgi:hypothetical protein